MRLLVKRDLRKHPGQAVTILVLTLLAAAMLHTGLMLVTDYGRNIDRLAAQWNSPANTTILTDGPGAAEVHRKLQADPAVSGIELTASFGAMGTVDVAGERLTALINVVDLSQSGAIGAPAVVETGAAVDRPIWAPSVLSASGAYRLGDEITLETSQGLARFRVAGFIEDMYGGAPGMGLLTFGLDGPSFAMFGAPGFAPTFNVKTKGDDVTAASLAVNRAVEEVQAGLPTDAPLYALWSNDLNLAKAAASMSSSIFVAMLVALALVIVLIAAVVTRFVLRNRITSDMVSIGTLRAAGFTTSGVIGALVATFGVIAVAGALLGSGLSYLLLPSIAESFRAQNGLGWAPQFSGVALLVTVATMLAVVLATASLAALRVRKVTTVGALRGGIATHSFTSTRLPLATTRGRLSTLLGLKAGLRQSGQNVLMGLTVATVTFAAVFALGMVGSLLGDRGKATELMVGKIEDVSVYPTSDADSAAMLKELQAMPGVSRAFFQAVNGINVDGRAIGFAVTPDPSLDSFDPLVEGRMPKHDNEVAIGGRLANVLGIKVGGNYTLDLGHGPAEYLVTGITSTARNLGQNVTLSTAGFRRLQPNFRDHNIAVYTADPEATIAAAKATFGAELDSVTNQRENVEAQLGSYLSMVPIIGTFMISFTVLVTVLVVGLVVTTMLVQTHRELGIKKAMGFTNRQLSAQTRWTYLPAIALGAVVGSLVGAVTLSPLLGALLSQVGIMRIDVSADWLTAGAIAAAVTVVGGLVMWVSSLRIGRISAYALVTE